MHAGTDQWKLGCERASHSPVKLGVCSVNSLFIYQDENEDKNQNQSFCLFLYVHKPVMNVPINLCNVILRAWFVRHRYYLERTKTFVLGFVFMFVLAHEQAISKNWTHFYSFHAHFLSCAFTFTEQYWMIGQGPITFPIVPNFVLTVNSNRPRRVRGWTSPSPRYRETVFWWLISWILSWWTMADGWIDIIKCILHMHTATKVNQIGMTKRCHLFKISSSIKEGPE